MSDPLPSKPRSCYKCGYFAETADKVCPNCSRPLHTTTATRVRGGLMAACGLTILVIIGTISLAMANALSNPTPGGARFNGNEQEKLASMAPFAMLLTFGGVATLLGTWQLIAGRRNRVASWIAVGFALLVFAAGGIMAVMLKRPR